MFLKRDFEGLDNSGELELDEMIVALKKLGGNSSAAFWKMYLP